MLIDWLTLKICSSLINPDVLAVLRSDANLILCVSPDGELQWESISRVSIRSDTHQLAVSVGGFVTITGSPARFFPDESGIHDNVFGSLDIVYNANLMLGHIEDSLKVSLPNYKKWDITRIDVTENYFVKGGSYGVEQVLSHWRSAEMGKYKTATYGDSVYIQKGNKINSGKAYYKGAQLKKNYRKLMPEVMEHIKTDYCFDDVACQLALDQVCSNESLNDFEVMEKTKHIHNIWSKAEEASRRLKFASSILRLEATFGSRYWNEKNKQTGAYLYKLKEWYNYSANDLKKLFDDYFDTRIGKGVDVKETNNLKDLFTAAAIRLDMSPVTGENAYKTLSLVRQLGKFEVFSKNNSNSLLSRSTFYKHKKIALEAGLCMADFEGGVVVPFKRNSIDLIAVTSWLDIERLAS
jgi:II/X family phage/plasmid replication protein